MIQYFRSAFVCVLDITSTLYIMCGCRVWKVSTGLTWATPLMWSMTWMQSILQGYGITGNVWRSIHSSFTQAFHGRWQPGTIQHSPSTRLSTRPLQHTMSLQCKKHYNNPPYIFDMQWIANLKDPQQIFLHNTQAHLLPMGRLQYLMHATGVLHPIRSSPHSFPCTKAIPWVLYVALWLTMF